MCTTRVRVFFPFPYHGSSLGHHHHHPSPLRVINVIIITMGHLTATQWRNAPKHSTTMDSEGGTSTKQADFGPFDDANNYYGEQDCADAFDDDGLSAWYFDQA